MLVHEVGRRGEVRFAWLSVVHDAPFRQSCYARHTRAHDGGGLTLVNGFDDDAARLLGLPRDLHMRRGEGRAVPRQRRSLWRARMKLTSRESRSAASSA